VSRSRIAWLEAIVLGTAISLLSGCGGGGSGSSGGSGGSGGGGGGTSTTPDMGTLTFVSADDQYKISNASSGLLLGIQGQNQVAGTSAAQAAADSQNDQLWHFMPMNYSAEQFNVENLLTHQVLGISAAATTSGAQALQWADNGTNDHLWEFFKLTDGNYLIKNVNSNLYLTDSNSGTTSSATIDQEARATSGSGCTCQEWALTSTGASPYTAPLTVSGTGIYVHDPNMLKDPNGTYWLYGTHQTIAYSTDLTTFTYTTASSAQGACSAVTGTAWLTLDSRCPIIGPDFTSWAGLQTPPSDNNGQNTDVWAPDVIYENGTYYQYYAIPWEPSTGAEAVIGLATSATPYGPWTDQGGIVSSRTAATADEQRLEFFRVDHLECHRPSAVPRRKRKLVDELRVVAGRDSYHRAQYGVGQAARNQSIALPGDRHTWRRRRGIVHLSLGGWRHTVLLLFRFH